MQRFLIPLFSGSALIAIIGVLTLRYGIPEGHSLFALLDAIVIAALLVFAVTLLFLLFGGIFRKPQPQNE